MCAGLCVQRQSEKGKVKSDCLLVQSIKLHPIHILSFELSWAELSCVELYCVELDCFGYPYVHAASTRSFQVTKKHTRRDFFSATLRMHSTLAWSVSTQIIHAFAPHICVNCFQFLRHSRCKARVVVESEKHTHQKMKQHLTNSEHSTALTINCANCRV